MKKAQLTLGGLLPFVFACTDVADDRAEYDETVGHYGDADVQVDVDEGLAVVRKARPGKVVFWSSAPVWTAKVQAKFSDTLNVEVRNLIPDSTLSATDNNNEALSVELVDEPLPTLRRFSVKNGGGTVHLALVPPKVTDAATYQFAVLSDIQRAVTDVQDIFQRIAKEPDVDFVLSVGDLTDRGTHAELNRFESELKSLPIPFYATLGNHELFFASPAPFQDVFGRANFHFQYRGTAFTLVDSGSATLSPLTLDWLDGWLEGARSRVHVFATHIPPIDPIGIRGGAFASQIEAHQLVARLAEGRVDSAFYGHIHSYYAFTKAGIPSYISGGGGGRPELLDGVGRHYLVVRVGKSRIENVRKVEVD